MLLLGRTMLTLEGTLRVIDPEFSLAQSAGALMRERSDETIGDPQEIMQRELLHALPALRALPEHAETLAGQLRAGRLTVRTEHYAGGDRDVVNRWVDRVLVAAAGGGRARVRGCCSSPGGSPTSRACATFCGRWASPG